MEAVVVSGDHKLLTLETKPLVPKMDVSAVPSFASNATGSLQVTLDLYKISGVGSAENPIKAEAVGAASSPVAVALPMDGDGYLRSEDQTHGKWAVTFRPYAGKDMPLAPVDSSCAPMLKRVGPGLLVAMSCRGITGRVMLSAFDFNKYEIWEESMGQTPVPPTFVLAPDAGRFAMSRINTMDPDVTFGVVQSDGGTQEVRVYQAQTGDMLLKMSCSPILRTAENFDLTGGGTRLAVVRADAIEVYRLPELTKTDKADLATIAKMAPVAGGPGKIDMRALMSGDVANTPMDGATVNDQSPQGVVSAAEAPANGDSQKGRTAPTLLNPGEKPDFGKGNEPR